MSHAPSPVYKDIHKGPPSYDTFPCVAQPEIFLRTIHHVEDSEVPNCRTSLLACILMVIVMGAAFLRAYYESMERHDWPSWLRHEGIGSASGPLERGICYGKTWRTRGI